MSKKKSFFRGRVAQDAHKQETATSSYGYMKLPKGINVFTPEPGSRVRFDIVPYIVSSNVHMDRDEELDKALPGYQWYKRPYKIHRNIGANSESVVCPTSINKPCPICEMRAQRIKDQAEKDEIDALKVSYRNVYLIVPIDNKKYETEPHIFDISQFNFQKLLNKELEEDDRYEIFPDLEEGYTLYVRFDAAEIGGGKPFPQASRIDFEEREHSYKDSLLDQVPDLDELLVIHSYKELKSKFYEEEIDDDDTTEEKNDDEKETKSPFIRKKPDVKEDKPKRKPLTRRTVTKTEEKEDKNEETGDTKCPYGYEFALDNAQYEKCDNCEIFDDCMEANKKLKKHDTD